jgi:hypothetical protein
MIHWISGSSRSSPPAMRPRVRKKFVGVGLDSLHEGEPGKVLSDRVHAVLLRPFLCPYMPLKRALLDVHGCCRFEYGLEPIEARAW